MSIVTKEHVKLNPTRRERQKRSRTKKKKRRNRSLYPSIYLGLICLSVYVVWKTSFTIRERSGTLLFSLRAYLRTQRRKGTKSCRLRTFSFLHRWERSRQQREKGAFVRFSSLFFIAWLCQGFASLEVFTLLQRTLSLYLISTSLTQSSTCLSLQLLLWRHRLYLSVY